LACQTTTLAICAWGEKRKSTPIHRELYPRKVTAQHFNKKSHGLRLPAICLNLLQNLEVSDSKSRQPEI